MRSVRIALIALSIAALAPSALAATRIHGTIALPPEPAHESPAQEAREAKRLAPLAKISKAQAIAAARRVASGKIKEAALDNEGGYLVYSVTIGQREVLVDAGNGKVLANQNADD